jgi:hypothetical protein
MLSFTCPSRRIPTAGTPALALALALALAFALTPRSSLALATLCNSVVRVAVAMPIAVAVAAPLVAAGGGAATATAAAAASAAAAAAAAGAPRSTTFVSQCDAKIRAAAVDALQSIAINPCRRYAECGQTPVRVTLSEGAITGRSPWTHMPWTHLHFGRNPRIISASELRRPLPAQRASSIPISMASCNLSPNLIARIDLVVV